VSLRSSLYVGTVMHRRIRPRSHHFRYRAFWLLVDLDELPFLSETLWLFSHNRPGVFSLYDTDHGDGNTTPLRLQIDRQLGEVGLDIGDGRVRLLCMPRTLGYVFNPLSVYFCHHADGTLAALVYQVHNTFGERHSYVIPVTTGCGAVHQQCEKSFYVSPFMEMNLHYDFRIIVPDEQIAVGMRVATPEGLLFNAALAARRKELSDGTLIRLCLTFPLLTLKVIAAIHWEALRLWLKGIPYRPRPAALESMISVVPLTPRNSD
jgi:DUF1365 family protein